MGVSFVDVRGVTGLERYDRDGGSIGCDGGYVTMKWSSQGGETEKSFLAVMGNICYLLCGAKVSRS